MQARIDTEELLRLDAEKEIRERFNLFRYVYPDQDNIDFSGNANRILYARSKYLKHIDFFKAGLAHRQRLFCAGNRVGKSFAGLYELTCHITGLYPSWWEGKRFHRPVTVWVGGFNLKMMKDSVMAGLVGMKGAFGTGMLPKDLFASDPTSAPGVPGAIESVNAKHASGGISTIQFKSYDSGPAAFAGASVDIIMFDEEPPLLIYIEGLTRTATTNGIIFTTFTPDRGFSETVLHFFENGEFHEGRVGEKWVTVCGWDNAPHLNEQTKRELWSEYPPYLRDAKTKGIPYLGTGAVYPILEEDFVIKPFEIPAHWPRAFGLDVGFNWTAAVFGAYDKKQDTWYIYDEFVGRSQAADINAMQLYFKTDGWIEGVIDKASLGTDQAAGTHVFDIYSKHKVRVHPSVWSKHIEPGIQLIHTRLVSRRLKVFYTCQNLLNEFRVYRRNDKGVPIGNDHFLDALRYLNDGGQHILRTCPIPLSDDDFNATTHYKRDSVTGY